MSILPGFDKEVNKKVTSKLLSNIVSGENKRRPPKVRRQQPSRFPKRIGDRYKKLTIYQESKREVEQDEPQTDYD